MERSQGTAFNEHCSSASEIQSAGCEYCLHHHQINHHYRKIPSHSNVAAEITRNIINIREAHGAQDISGQRINQMNFNIGDCAHYIRAQVLIRILSFFF